jgi:hypothetical protein
LKFVEMGERGAKEGGLEELLEDVDEFFLSDPISDEQISDKDERRQQRRKKTNRGNGIFPRNGASAT